MLLNYLAGYRRRRAALMEWNSTGDLERLEKVCTGMVRESSAYRVLEADYFKHAGPRELAMALGAGYFCAVKNSSWWPPSANGSRKISGSSPWKGSGRKKRAGSIWPFLAAMRPEKSFGDVLASFPDGFRFQRMPSRSRRSAGNFFSVSCKNDIKGRFP